MFPGTAPRGEDFGRWVLELFAIQLVAIGDCFSALRYGGFYPRLSSFACQFLVFPTLGEFNAADW
jgi:hypothetical protein